MSESNGVVWEDPPEEKAGTGVWHERLAPLMARPGVWARIAERPQPSTARTVASNLRKRMVRVPEGDWEFVSRQVDGTAYVYARYLGPDLRPVGGIGAAS